MSFTTGVKTGVSIMKTSKRERIDLECDIPNKRSKIDNESHNFEEADGELWGDELDDFTQDDIESIDTIIASQQCPINKTENRFNRILKNDVFSTVLDKTRLPASSFSKQNNNTLQTVYTETFKSKNSQSAEKGHCQLREETITNQNENNSLKLEKLLLENEEKSKEIEKLHQSQFSKDGQVKMLRESLAQKETELQKLRQERVSELEVQTRKQSDREKKLVVEVEKLNTQMQFKEQELLELQNAHRRLEKQHMGTVVDTCRSPMRKHLSPSASATKLDKLSPKSVFPTKETFMVGHRPKCDTMNVSGSIEKDKQTPSISQTRKSRLTKNYRMKLMVSGSKGCVSGSNLVGRMLQAAGTVSNDNPGIGDIFHSSQTRFQKTTTDTEAQMGPAGSISNVSAPVTCTGPPSYASVDPASQKGRLAIQSLALMLNSTKIDNKDIRRVLCSSTESAVLCLPAIENHVTNYHNVLQTVLESQFASPPTGALSNRGSPTSASLESMTSSFDSLLNDEISVLETCGASTLTALQTLEVLVDYSHAVRAALLSYDVARSSQQEMDCDEETDQRNSLHVVTTKDPSVSSPMTSVSPVSLDSTISQVISESNLLQQLIKLANPCIFRKKFINLPVTQTALQILSKLSQSADVVQLDSLEPLIIEDALYNCLKQQGDITEEYQSSLAYAALDLITDLMQSSKLVSKLTLSSSDNSLLQAICRLGIRPPSLDPDQKTALTAKVIFMLSNIFTQEKAGWSCLAGKDNAFCPQIMKAVVLSLHREYRYYRENQTAASLQLLRKGVLLLHTLFTQDAEYNKHYQDIHHEYVEVICGLDNLYREIPEVCDQEVSAIQELWDFEQEYPENSTDDQDAEEVGEDFEMPKAGGSQ